MAVCRNLSELIAELTSLKAVYGDLPVTDAYENAIEPEVDEPGTEESVVVICDKA